MMRNPWARYPSATGWKRIGCLRCCTNKGPVNNDVLTCPFGHHQFRFTPGSIPFGGVCSHCDGVNGVWLESSNDHFLWETAKKTGAGKFWNASWIFDDLTPLHAAQTALYRRQSKSSVSWSSFIHFYKTCIKYNVFPLCIRRPFH